MNVTSDPGRAVGMETPMMGLLVSGSVCARLEQRKTEEFSKQPCCRRARICFSVNREKVPPLHVFYQTEGAE